MISTYKFRLSTRITIFVGVAFFLVLFVGAIWIIISASKYSDYAIGGIAAVIFGISYKMHAKHVIHCLWYQLQIGDAGVSMREGTAWVTIPVVELVAFKESVMTGEDGISGYQFWLESATGTTVAFSTQIVGWAEAIDEMHKLIPRIVPPAASVRAQSLLDSETLSAAARAFTAPPYKTNKVWAEDGVARWYDYWIGVGVTVALYCLAGKYLGNWLGVFFKANGWPTWSALVVILLPAILAFQSSTNWFANGILWLRKTIRARFR